MRKARVGRHDCLIKNFDRKDKTERVCPLPFEAISITSILDSNFFLSFFLSITHNHKHGTMGLVGWWEWAAVLTARTACKCHTLPFWSMTIIFKMTFGQTHCYWSAQFSLFAITFFPAIILFNLRLYRWVTKQHDYSVRRPNDHRQNEKKTVSTDNLHKLDLHSNNGSRNITRWRSQLLLRNENDPNARRDPFQWISQHYSIIRLKIKWSRRYRSHIITFTNFFGLQN